MFPQDNQADVNERKRRLIKLGIIARSLTNHIYDVFAMEVAFCMLSRPKSGPAMVKIIYFFIS